jgi:hypothetical protein
VTLPRPDDPAPAHLRAAYERGRLGTALRRALPSSLFLAVVVLEGAPVGRLALASLLVASAVLAHVVGRGAARAVLPALLLALVPFAVVRIAESAGHVCLGESCVSWCLPACAFGGLLGGVGVGVVGARDEDRAGFVLAAATLAILGGALGCVCAGGAGMSGVALGTVLGLAPSLALALRRA